MAKNIEVTLTLDTKKFNSGMKRAQTQMKGFGGQANVTKGSIMGLAARFAPLAIAAVGVGAAFKGLAASVETARKIEDIGVVMRNIVGSADGGAIALQKVRDVASKLPFDLEAVAGAAPALATVSKDTNELGDNMMLVADIAATTGMSFEDTASQLQRAFSGGAGAADMFREKGVLAMAGFEAGASFSIEETRRKLRLFGKSVEGAAEQLSKTFGGAQSLFNDQMMEMRLGIGNAILPEFTAFLTGITEALVGSEEGVQGFAKGIGETVVNAFFLFLQGGAIVIDFVRMLIKQFNNAAKFIQDNFGDVIVTVMDVAVKAIGGVVEALAFMGKGIGALIEKVTGDSGMKDYFQGIEDAANTARTGGIETFKQAIEELGDAQGLDTGAQDMIAQLIASMKEAGDAADADAQKTKDRLKDLGEDANETIKNGAKGIAESQAMYATASENLLSTVSDATKAMSTDITTALMNGQDVLGSFKDFFKKIISQVISEALRLMVIQPILNSIFGSFGFGFDAGGTLGKIKPKAMGGPVMKNKPYITGERGEELFIPSTNGTIIPNHMLGNGGQTPGKTVVTYNINAVDARSFRQLVASDPEFIYTVTQAGRRRIPR